MDRSEADSRAADWIQAGAIRLALFLPQYAQDPATHEIRGADTGVLAIELVRVLAGQLGIAAKVAGLPTPADVEDALKSGGCDIAFMGIVPSRTAVLGFSPPAFQFDFTYLVPGGSRIRTVADADRPGVRIAFVRHHAAAMALERIVKNATLVGHELPDEALTMLRDGQADALAFPRGVLVEFSAQLPGSRVLAESYGVNRVGIAVQKGKPDRVALVREFVESAKASGLIQRTIEQAGLQHAFQVSPREPAASP